MLSVLLQGTERNEEHMAETAYCVRCKEKREIKDSTQVTMKNGKPALQGVCTVCGVRAMRILPTKKVAVEAETA